MEKTTQQFKSENMYKFIEMLVFINPSNPQHWLNFSSQNCFALILFQPWIKLKKIFTVHLLHSKGMVHTSWPGWELLCFLPHEEVEMTEHECDFRRLCLVSVVLISVSAAKKKKTNWRASSLFSFLVQELSSLSMFSKFSIIRRQQDQTGSLLLKPL